MSISKSFLYRLTIVTSAAVCIATVIGYLGGYGFYFEYRKKCRVRPPSGIQSTTNQQGVTAAETVKSLTTAITGVQLR